jgi:hypothetical protein
LRRIKNQPEKWSALAEWRHNLPLSLENLTADYWLTEETFPHKAMLLAHGEFFLRLRLNPIEHFGKES